MLVSDVSIKFNRKLGFAHRRDVDIQKLINLSKQIYNSYYDDNEKMKRKLKRTLKNSYKDCIETAEKEIKQCVERRLNQEYRMKYGIPDVEISMSDDEDETIEEPEIT